MMSLFERLFNSVNMLAIINDTTNTLAVVTDKQNSSSNLNYVIGGLFVIIIVLVGATIFNKK
jgi:hypothetical protein